MGQLDPSHIARLAGSEVQATRRVSGGSTSQAMRIDLTDGRSLFVKQTHGAPPGLFGSEADGLAWIAAPGSVRVPEVIGTGDDWLALEWIEQGERTAATDEELGRGLARMHRSGADAFGAPWAGFAGSVPVPNDPADDWPSFLAERRLLPVAHAARLPHDMLRRLDHVVARLPQLVGPPEPPSRLHGDLWAGNHLTDRAGRPVLIDCDAYAGHREVDIGMMLLFGGFGDRVIDAYEEEFPLAPGWRERVEVNQLLPLLVHCAMLGASWLPQTDAVLRNLA